MKPIGIDLGTTNSAISVFENGASRTLLIDGKYTIPSVVFVGKDEVLIGAAAKRRMVLSPESVLSSTKRELGSSWVKQIDGKPYDAVYAAKEVLAYLINQARLQFPGEQIRNAVITVPAYFTTEQKAETKKAAEEAGIVVEGLIAEPTAAAVAYGVDKEGIDQTIVVIDLGGGTFDVSVLEVKSNQFTVKAVGGNARLGGDDFDMAIVSFLLKHIQNNTGKDLSGNPLAILKLKEEAENIKIELSSSLSVPVSIAGLPSGVLVDIESFTRKDYQKSIQAYLDEIVNTTQAVIKDAKLGLDDINRFILVGGSCKSPIITELITQHFKQPYDSPDIDTAVSRGAAIYCNSLLVPVIVDPDAKERDDSNLPLPVVIKDVLPHSLGINLIDLSGSFFKKGKEFFMPILKKNTHFPFEGGYLAYTIDKWQKKVIVKVLRGEDIEPGKNECLGNLEMNISGRLLGIEPTPLGCVFNLDKDGLLFFTMIELVGDNSSRADFARIRDEAAANNGYVPYELFDLFKKKYNCMSSEIHLENTLR